MKSWDSMLARPSKTSQLNPSVLVATLPLLKSLLCSRTSTTPSKTRASELQQLSQFRTFASWILHCSLPFSNHWLASSSLLLSSRALKEFNKPSSRWSTSPSLNPTLNSTTSCRMTTPSKLLSANFWRISPSSSEARPSWPSYYSLRWTHNGWSSQSNKTSIRISTSCCETTTNTCSAAFSAWLRLWAPTRYPRSWLLAKRATLSSWPDSLKLIPTSLLVWKEFCRSLRRSSRTWRVD